MSRPIRAEAPSTSLTLRLSPDERERVDQAATAMHQTASAWARDAFETYADACLPADLDALAPFVGRNSKHPSH